MVRSPFLVDWPVRREVRRPSPWRPRPETGDERAGRRAVAMLRVTLWPRTPLDRLRLPEAGDLGSSGIGMPVYTRCVSLPYEEEAPRP